MGSKKPWQPPCAQGGHASPWPRIWLKRTGRKAAIRIDWEMTNSGIQYAKQQRIICSSPCLCFMGDFFRWIESCALLSGWKNCRGFPICHGDKNMVFGVDAQKKHHWLPYARSLVENSSRFIPDIYIYIYHKYIYISCVYIYHIYIYIWYISYIYISYNDISHIYISYIYIYIFPFTILCAWESQS